MIPFYRKSLFRIFILFFLLVSPFLVIYSLGYSFDLQNQGLNSNLELSNSLELRVETLPSGAQIYNRDQKIFENTPIDLVARDNQVLDISIRKEGYLSEDFRLWAKPEENFSVKITKLFLLPSVSEEIFKFENKNPITLLSENEILFQERGEFYVGLYSFGGFLDQSLPIKNETKKTLFSKNWDVLHEDAYWSFENQSILTKSDLSWDLIDLEILPFQTISAVKAGDENFLLLDGEGRVWFFDTEKKQYRFLENNVDGVAYTESPDYIWILKNDKIYFLPRNSIFEEEDFYFLENLYSENLSLIITESEFRDIEKTKLEVPYFSVRNVFQGLAFKVGDELFYVSDADRQNWNFIAKNVITFTTKENLLVWLDSENNLRSYNFFPQKKEYFGKLDLQGNPRNFSITYYNPWKRILVYSDKQVYSTWYDKDLINPAITSYKSNLWIKNHNCQGNIFEKYQFCLKDNSLVNYKNTYLSIF